MDAELEKAVDKEKLEQAIADLFTCQSTPLAEGSLMSARLLNDLISAKTQPDDFQYILLGQAISAAVASLAVVMKITMPQAANRLTTVDFPKMLDNIIARLRERS